MIEKILMMLIEFYETFHVVLYKNIFKNLMFYWSELRNISMLNEFGSSTLNRNQIC